MQWLDSVFWQHKTSSMLHHVDWATGFNEQLHKQSAMHNETEQKKERKVSI